MATTKPPTPSLQSQTDQLLADHAAVVRYIEFMRTLQARVLAYEAQFGIPSSEIHEAIDDGRLRETFDVTKWIMDFEMLSQAKLLEQ
ncbi:MAG TPA: hypothetical protein VFP05_14095 [Thermomicrobiales bacterium]|jgi:hypothetical protein|nr:hypothetical protein [Thermomicrobiales bacterium]